MTRRSCKLLLAIIAALSWLPTAALAEFYIYTDKDGVTHVTNIPPHQVKKSPKDNSA